MYSQKRRVDRVAARDELQPRVVSVLSRCVPQVSGKRRGALEHLSEEQ
jgi:hypothetical protein